MKMYKLIVQFKKQQQNICIWLTDQEVEHSHISQIIFATFACNLKQFIV